MNEKKPIILRCTLLIISIAFLTVGLVVAIVHVVSFYSRFDEILGISRTLLATGYVQGENAEFLMTNLASYEKAKTTAVLNLVLASIAYVFFMTLVILSFFSKIKIVSFSQLQANRVARRQTKSDKSQAKADKLQANRVARRQAKADKLQAKIDKLKFLP